MRVLLVEDDAELAELLLLGLRQASYATDHAATFVEAQALLEVTPYDVACIDLGLPDGDGLDLVAGHGEHGGGGLLPGAGRPRRTIVITARDAVHQRVAGLDAGADDYLVKPFDLEELLARVRAVARRQDEVGTRLEVGDLVLDLAERRAWRGGREISLTTREFALLHHFMAHPGRVLSAETLLEHVWDANTDPMSTTVRVILSRVRKKLGPPSPIETVEGAGYRLVVP